jgi:hypothetical protein
LSNRSEIKSSIITVRWTGKDETSGIDHYEIGLDDDSWINLGKNTTHTFKGIKDGSHILRLKAVDKANNSKEVKIRFSVNTSLIGSLGWTDDIAVFGASSLLIIGILFFLLRKRRGNRANPRHNFR